MPVSVSVYTVRSAFSAWDADRFAGIFVTVTLVPEPDPGR